MQTGLLPARPSILVTAILDVRPSVKAMSEPATCATWQGHKSWPMADSLIGTVESLFSCSCQTMIAPAWFLLDGQ